MNLHKLFTLSLVPTLYVLFVLLSELLESGLAQNPDPLFELPVQLIGFPVIVLSVRLSQFAKKLAYSLNPSTYRSRTKRDAALLAYDADLAQKEILNEFGPRACILEEPCRIHASRPANTRGVPISATIPPAMPVSTQQQLHAPWNELLSNYKVQSTGMKQWYLLSVYLGDAVRDVALCKHLAKRLPCPGVGPLPPPQPR